MPNSNQSSLLDSARALMRKSASTSVLVIAPLAALSTVPEAQAATIFDLPTNTSGGSGGSVPHEFRYVGGTPTGPPNAQDVDGVYSNIFSSNRPESNGISGVTFGQTSEINFTGSGSGMASFNLGEGNTSGDALPALVTIPIAYNFSLESTGSVSVDTWEVFSYLGTGASDTGSGSGDIAGTFDIASASGSFYYSIIRVNYSGATDGSTIRLTMQPGSQGLAYNAVAVPEPSSFVLCIGAAGLGFAGYRRRV